MSMSIRRSLATFGLAQADVNTTLSTAWGGTFVNDFVDRGRVKKVYIEGDAPFRSNPSDLNQWYVRASSTAAATTTATATGSTSGHDRDQQDDAVLVVRDDRLADRTGVAVALQRQEFL